MIYHIQDAAASASIDSFGAQLISLKDGEGREYIWQRDPEYWSECSPLLFPVVGRVRNGRTEINGKWYELPLHGFLRTSQFEVLSQSGEQITFTLSDSEETRRVYPFHFRFSITYALSGGVLSMKCRVENTGDEMLPFFIGLHPGFNCPMQEGERFEDYLLEFDQKETGGCRLIDVEHTQFDMSRTCPLPEDGYRIPLDYSLFVPDAFWFDRASFRKVALKHARTGKGVEVAFPDFSTVAFWTPAEKHAPLLCIEPWNGSAACSDEDDQFLHKNHLQTLEAGEKADYEIRIRIL
ncbi:MAG: aldose 1-epimerase family protein [Lachnospiraceae bacterium]|nr:aldose 1-epimerase family protein [Lachnospiraceae bacterium]